MAAQSVNAKASSSGVSRLKDETERSFKVHSDKLRELDMWLPQLKEQVREFFQASNSVKAIFLQIDDFYHLN
jgi:hypothetical protein